MSEWIEWAGGDCPVNEGTRIDVQFRDETVTRGVAALFQQPFAGGSNGTWTAVEWTHTDEDGDIIAYRIVEDTAQ